MLGPNIPNGGKNLISKQLRKIREERGLSQNALAKELQLNGCDIDKNCITRIENNKRHVTDVELKAFVDVFGVDYGYFIDGTKGENTEGGLQ